MLLISVLAAFIVKLRLIPLTRRIEQKQDSDSLTIWLFIEKSLFIVTPRLRTVVEGVMFARCLSSITESLRWSLSPTGHPLAFVGRRVQSRLRRVACAYRQVLEALLPGTRLPGAPSDNIDISTTVDPNHRRSLPSSIPTTVDPYHRRSTNSSIARSVNID